MNRIDQLTDSYSKYISVPWREDAAADQRVIFCVYNESDERTLRAKVYKFEEATVRAGHGWALFDLTDTFAVWLSGQRYAKSYFQRPHLLPSLHSKYLEFITSEAGTFLREKELGANDVLAVQGLGSLFGFLKVKETVDKLAPLVKGRLLVFFPGTCEKNNYRLLNAYDGWNYLAVQISAYKAY